MTTHNELRLLPWSGPEGQPCYLSTEARGGYLSRLADNTEAEQMERASELLDHALDVLGDAEAGRNELRLLAREMSGSLRDVHRVAISRGDRLPPTDPPTWEGGDEDPQLPAAAFG